MRELDVLLVGYLEHRYEQADNDEQAAFRAVLRLSDPELMGYLLRNELPPADLAGVVTAILDRPGG